MAKMKPFYSETFSCNKFSAAGATISFDGPYMTKVLIQASNDKEYWCDINREPMKFRWKKDGEIVVINVTPVSSAYLRLNFIPYKNSRRFTAKTHWGGAV